MMLDETQLCVHGLEEGAVDADPGQWALHDPTVDLDGDGVLDTRGYADGDTVLVASDLDGNGYADHLTSVDGDGRYAAWQAQRSETGELRWERTEIGNL
ncbi:DUF6802 family protein [Rhodococcus kronopolitis]|uniref:DUF6802 family protein n=1 Tax=Rhodococcus kronopolitis TaxID=1460226 RepID=A0ABV9FS86_9NOCA